MSHVAALLARRWSCRAYLDRPVPRSTVEDLLRAARRAPSGANLQPGHFHALTGAALGDLRHALAAAHDAGRPEVSEYAWFPEIMTPDLKDRQRAAGYALYAALGIPRRDLAGRAAQFRRNFRFFDAPVGLVVTIRRDMGAGGFMDLGFTLMALMLAAEDLGLATTGIGALARRADVVSEALGLDPSEMVVCGVALGWPDRTAPVNGFRTTREDLDGYASLRGFPPRGRSLRGFPPRG